ncbi:hypothetical protein [uncultured Rikenella sp.]|uniref:hypothetical protein n=1 Tax=uncultured Rikenella sp. TaxID=368003 RepID=UPI002603758C|nr:hypothetical protein [uncultured Rikenella sp.]
MKRYPIRAAKYAIYLIILFFILFALLRAFGSASPISVLWSTSRGLLFLGVVIVFALLYPFFGFTRKRLTFNAAARSEDVERVMGMCGFKRIDTENHSADNMLFQAASTAQKIVMMWEDQIEITTIDGISYIEGNRKAVVRAAFRMGTYIA